MKRYEQVPHTADLAVIIYGENLNNLFDNAAFAMFDMMADIKPQKSNQNIKVKVEGPDIEGLLIAWLNELLYLSFYKSLIFNEYNIISIKEAVLEAEVKGYSFLEKENPIKKEIKAATYHDVHIEKKDNIYQVRVVFDV